jgi:hypothetical protein
MGPELRQLETAHGGLRGQQRLSSLHAALLRLVNGGKHIQEGIVWIKIH